MAGHPSAVVPSCTTFSLMTYNLWKSDGVPTAFDVREPVLRRQLARLDPDILLTQELHPKLTDCVLGALTEHAHVAPEANDPPGWLSEGNIFWRTSLFQHREHGAAHVGHTEPHRRLFWVRLAAAGHTILCATAHFTWQGAAAECESDVNVRKDQARRTVRALEEIRRPSDAAIFFGGDLNEAYWPRRILTEAGYSDCFSALGLPAVPTHPTRPSVAVSMRMLRTLRTHATAARAEQTRPSNAVRAQHEERLADTALDWIFCRGDARVLLASTIKDMCGLSSDDADERHCLAVVPSDHMPVMAVYRLRTARTESKEPAARGKRKAEELQAPTLPV